MAKREITVTEGERAYQFRAPEGDHIGKIMAASEEFYEVGLLRAIRKLHRAGMYFDVGAYIGTHSVWFATQCPATRVIAVEPNPIAYGYLQSNVAHLPIVSLVPAACGAGKRTTSLISPTRSNLGMTKVDDDGLGPKVEMLTVDGILSTATKLGIVSPVDHVAVLKIDVEGYEARVLQGAGVMLRCCRPAIVVEANTDAEKQAVDALIPSGYRFAGTYNRTPTHIWIPEC